MTNSSPRSLSKRVLVALLIVAGTLLFCLVLCPALFLYVCNRDEIYSRPVPVNAQPLLTVDIPPDEDVLQWEVILDPWISPGDWHWDIRDVPLGLRGANTFLKRYPSESSALQAFAEICQSGWLDEDWNRQFRTRVTYGGDQGNQFCASPIVQWRYDASSLCSLSGQFWSYVIFQKADVLVAIYEDESTGLADAGVFTNEAIQSLADRILAR